ncbi:class IIb bacteriocin, lactobin A/cerein 7B family [Ningiella sp. W23]
MKTLRIDELETVNGGVLPIIVGAVALDAALISLMIAMSASD